MKEAVSIIILNHNGSVFIEKCISSVLNQSYENFEIVFLDNASTDESCELMSKMFRDDRIKIIRSDKNLGFAGGNNQAMKYCSNDLIVLLNNDTEVDRNWLNNLVQAVKEKNTVASSYVITEGIPEKYYKTNGSVSYLMYNVMNVFKSNDQIFYPNGCSVIFRKSEIPEPFDEEYFFYGEDVYLGLLARFSDMKIKFARDSLVFHKGSGTKSASETKTFYQERNRFLNLYTFFSWSYILRILPYIFFNHSTNLILSLIDRKKSFTGLLKAYVWFYFNIPVILRKRKKMKAFKKLHEKEIIKYMTSKVFNGENFLERLVNKISYFYSRLVGLKPYEYYSNELRRLSSSL
ncbi:MAG: glycosyltransferase family 2 protein [Ignavibacteria bacterium]|nr:glycosyltransferase family 2 protein [Ignavibacteria bacterium]